MVYGNIHLLHYKSPKNAYKVDHISLSKRIFKDATVKSGNLGVFLKTQLHTWVLKMQQLLGVKKQKYVVKCFL